MHIAAKSAHGNHAYGEDDFDDQETLSKVGVQHLGSKCRCGSSTHNRTSHWDCPLNKKRKVDVNPIVPETEDSDTVPKGSLCGHGLSSDGSCDEWFSDDLCFCGASNRAHKSHCPLNSRNYPSLDLLAADDPLPPQTVEPRKQTKERQCHVQTRRLCTKISWSSSTSHAVLLMLLRGAMYSVHTNVY